MKKFEVKWNETRVFKCSAEVYAESAEAAVAKARAYEIDEDLGEYVEEHESYTEASHPGKATEIDADG